MTPAPVVFLHLPKCAGQTIDYILRRQYPRHAILHTPGGIAGIEFLQHQTPDTFKKMRLIQGHLPYGIHEIIGRPVTYFTMLRHPIDRIISHYHFVQRTPDHYLHEKVTSLKMSLADYATSNLAPELNNGLLRLLCGIDGERLPDVGEAELNRAKLNLEQITTVGITERFDESVLLFQQILGWKTPVYRSTNVNQKRGSDPYMVDEATRQIIAEQNALDIVLYDFAYTLFERQLAQNLSNLNVRLQTFRFQQIIHEWTRNTLLQRSVGKIRSIFINH